VANLWLSVDKEPIKDVQRILGHNMGPGALGHMEPEPCPDFMRACLTTNISDPERFLHYIAGQFGYKVPEGGIAEFMKVLDRERLNLAKYADADPTLLGLRQRGYRLGLISNLWRSRASHLRAHRIPRSLRTSHLLVSSVVIGSRTRRSSRACRRFGVQPEQCLMVGDHPEPMSKAH